MDIEVARSAGHVAPCIHDRRPPTSYILHPTSYILHPTSYILYHAHLFVWACPQAEQRADELKARLDVVQRRLDDAQETEIKAVRRRIRTPQLVTSVHAQQTCKHVHIYVT